MDNRILNNMITESSKMNVYKQSAPEIVFAELTVNSLLAPPFITRLSVGFSMC